MTSYAYNSLYQKAARHAAFLTTELLEDESTNVWPAGCKRGTP